MCMQQLQNNIKTYVPVMNTNEPKIMLREVIKVCISGYFWTVHVANRFTQLHNHTAVQCQGPHNSPRIWHAWNCGFASWTSFINIATTSLLTWESNLHLKYKSMETIIIFHTKRQGLCAHTYPTLKSNPWNPSYSSSRRVWYIFLTSDYQ